MPTPVGIFSAGEDESTDLRLWIGMLLPPVAGGVNTLVAYMVSNYDCNVHNRRLVFLVNVLSALLCVLAGAAAYSVRVKIRDRAGVTSESLTHTRHFMMWLGLCLAAGFLLFICAGTLSTLLLGPCDL